MVSEGWPFDSRVPFARSLRAFDVSQLGLGLP